MSVTLGRSPSRDSHMSTAIASPLLSVPHDVTPPVMPDLSLVALHERLHTLESQVTELRSVVLTRDEYVDRRNREDEHIRREFDAHNSKIERIEADIAALFHETALIRQDVTSLQKDVAQLKKDVAQLQKDVAELQKDVAQLKKDVAELKTELRECRSDIKQLTHRFDSFEFTAKHANQVRFNALAILPNAPITPVPKQGEDGTLLYPRYFPSTVFRFWLLKKRNYVRRLIELAEFYEIEGYQTWDRNPPDYQPFDDKDFKEADSERPNGLPRASAVLQYPEAAHQALAAVLGLNYYKIRKAAREDPGSPTLRVRKRNLDQIAPNQYDWVPVPKAKQPKLEITPSIREKLLAPYEESVLSKSPSIDDDEYVFWRDPGRGGSDVSSKTKAKIMARDLKGVSLQDLLRGIDMGWIKVVDEPPYARKTSSRKSKNSEAAAAAPAEHAAGVDIPTVPLDEDAAARRTVSTKVIPPRARISRTPSPPFSGSTTSDVS